MRSPQATIVIPTLDRPQELKTCLASLKAQLLDDIQIILLTQRGPLAYLRNQGLYQARAPIVCFIDDDVICSPRWLSNILKLFRESPGTIGVTGPAPIPVMFKKNRDLFKFKYIRRFYDKFFIQPFSLPGHLTLAGTFVPEPDYTYSGPVQFLEACNMSFRTEAIKAVAGFDEAYGGIGDWSEPDVCFRLRQRYGTNCLQFNPNVYLEHRPSKSGAYRHRRSDARQRLTNYHLFASRWVVPTWRHRLYCWLLRGYYSWQAHTLL